MSAAIEVSMLINQSERLLSLTPELYERNLPGGASGSGPILMYGPYLNAILDFLRREAWKNLLLTLWGRLGREVREDEVSALEIISEKHGAFYNVARLRVFIDARCISFAINVAAGPERRAVLEAESSILNRLNTTFDIDRVPPVYLLGHGSYGQGSPSEQGLSFMLTKWYDLYGEFHLTREPSGQPRIKVWDSHSGYPALTDEIETAIYRDSSKILTGYLDAETFSEIYPWHHAAGDFIVRISDGTPDLRLITVRGYQPIIQPGPDREQRIGALLHFLIRLSIRMRLDRFDGTGELAWAGPHCVAGTLDGFLHALDHKTRSAHLVLPSSAEMLEIMRQLSVEDWFSLSAAILEETIVEPEERVFLLDRLRPHAVELARLIAGTS